MLAIALALCALMGWGLVRVAKDGDAGISGSEASGTWIKRPATPREPTTV